MIQVTDATLLVNNEAVGIVPNTLVFTEGKGEQSVRAMSTGGGGVEQVFANNLETNFSTIKFSLPVTIDNVKLAKGWKVNGNQNVVQIAGFTVDGDLTRTFTQAALINDYEVAIGTETDIEIEMNANAAI